MTITTLISLCLEGKNNPKGENAVKDILVLPVVDTIVSSEPELFSSLVQQVSNWGRPISMWVV